MPQYILSSDHDSLRKERIESEMLRADEPSPKGRNGAFLAGMSRMAGQGNPLASQVLKMVSSDPMPRSNAQYSAHRELHGY